jgi:hypothetical protein
VRGLVGIAVSNRVQLDHMLEDRNGPDGDASGDLQEDLTKYVRIDLAFRAACNKIIYAVHITSVTDIAEGPAKRPLNFETPLRACRLPMGSIIWLSVKWPERQS